MTPVPAAIARPLIEGLRNDVVVRDDLARRLFPGVNPVGYAQALAAALANLESGDIESAWSDALSTSQGAAPPVTSRRRRG